MFGSVTWNLTPSVARASLVDYRAGKFVLGGGTAGLETGNSGSGKTSVHSGLILQTSISQGIHPNISERIKSHDQCFCVFLGWQISQNLGHFIKDNFVVSLRGKTGRASRLLCLSACPSVRNGNQNCDDID